MSKNIKREVKRLMLLPWQVELFKPYRYKVLYGGRGSGKSYAVADALIALTCQQKCLILCGREFQTSIKNSVHRLISSRISALGLEPFFTITKNEIRNKASGSEFFFVGLERNIDNIKSIPELTHVWIEEADVISANSWEVLVPTIRNPNSEIWITMNPKNKTDILYQEFIASNTVQGSDMFRIELNWKDNPYLSDVALKEKDRCKEKNTDLYNHIWQGECLEHSDAQIFKDKWKVSKFDEPKNVHKYYGLDFGFNDPVAVIACYVHDNKLFITHEAVKTKLDIDKIKPFIEKMIPDLGKHTIYADCANPEQISFLKKQGLNIKPVSKGKGSIEDGIAYIRSFDFVYINERCLHTANEFQKYSYKVDPRSGDIMDIIVDKDNHTIDAIRYALERSMKRKGCSYQNWDMESLRQVQGL